MEDRIRLSYFYGKEADQFSFYKIPKLLFTEEYFKKISVEAKVLYGLMLDRMSLSVKNQWMDEEGRAYIYYSLEDIMDALGNEYHDYNLVMATTFGLPIGDSYLRNKMQDIIDELGLPDVVFHSLRHTSVTYKLKLSGGDIKAVQGDSRHAQADMVIEVYGHIIDEDRRKNAEMMENAFYNKENLNPQMREDKGDSKKIEVPDGVDAELLMKVLANPEMAALLTSLAKTMK